MFISPFVFGYGESHFATDNMIFGALVVILGVETIFYELYHKERFEKETAGAMEHVIYFFSCLFPGLFSSVFCLIEISSISKMRVALGPMTPLVPRSP